MDIARLNLSHGTLEEHARTIKNVREQSNRAGRKTAILIDLPGPKYRIGKLAGGKIELKKGSTVYLTSKISKAMTRCWLRLPNLAEDIAAGDKVILDDGGSELKVIAIEDSKIKCRVVYGGTLLQGKGLVVPGMKISVPFITDNLRKDILFAIKQKPDYIALSFVTCAKDINDARALFEVKGANIPVISKIGTRARRSTISTASWMQVTEL